uniref:DENN domain-containing protein 5A n=1 Tax=Clytia hemisphaerica TaxID=252671 RepID=A0A7M5X9F3_9CNID
MAGRRQSDVTSDRLVDYFVICGLDECEGLEAALESGTGESSLTPFQLSYKPSVLWHYPENDLSNVFEAEGIKLLCMPRGVYFRKYITRNQRKFHSFLQTREDGTKIYGFVLTFFEEIKNTKLLLAMDTLFKMFDLELLSKSTPASNQILDRKEKKRRRVQRGRSVYSFNKEVEPLYASKCISLIMKQPFFTLAHQLLENILDIGLSESKQNLTVESYIYNALYEIPCPPPGRSMKYVSTEGDPIIITKPLLNELPYFDYSLKEVLMTLGYENLVDLFTCLLLEHQILFLSGDIHKLMLIAEALTTLFFPLSWEHVYVPVLPPSLLHYLDAPVPFIMGLYYETEEEKNRFEIPCEGSLCLLDIDQNDIQLPQEIPELPGRQELIKELSEIAEKFNITPPQGSLRLRHEISRSQEILNFNSSGDDESLVMSTSDLDNSFNSSQGVPTGTWPRKKTNNVYDPSAKSPLASDANGVASPMISPRHTGGSPSLKEKTTGNWAGERTPQIHLDPSAEVRLKRTESEEFLDQVNAEIQEDDDDDENEGLDTTTSDVGAETPEKVMNPRLAAVMAIAENAGINTSEILKGRYKSAVEQSRLQTTDLTKKEDLFVFGNRAMTVTRKQQHENEFNIAVREIFVNRFTQMLVDYEQFVILPKQTKEDWFNNRDQMQNFDKAAFLSDQSESILQFMTLFVETQGFASLIDMKIMALWEDCDPRLQYFDKRIDKLKVKLGIIRSSEYEKCTSVPQAIDTNLKRCGHIDHVASQPHTLKTPIERSKVPGYFPLPVKAALVETKRKKAGKINWRKRDKAQQQTEHIQLSEALKNTQDKYMQDSKMITKDMAQSSTVGHKTLFAFADKLLKECKIKTKRLVVLKLGQEAVELGHAGPNSSGIEENTLIASLCDLLERVWSHGVQLKQLEFGKEHAKSRFVQRMRQSKSALWSHLVAFYQRESERLAAVYGLTDMENLMDDVKKLIIEQQTAKQQQANRKPTTYDVLSENFSRAMRSRSPELDADIRMNRGHDRFSGGSRAMSLPTTPTMPSIDSRRQQELVARLDFLSNLKTVLDMKEIKTDTGYARAWTRLALEKKTLAKELRLLLGNKKILSTRYKDYAFIRTDDEIEQFLFHLLSLNAVDFYCFTNGFSNTLITYKVQVVMGKQMGSATTANCWLNLAGKSGNTGTVNIPKGDLEFRFRHKNLGILTALRIGHDNTGISAGWFIEFVAVMNEVTGHTYKFQCGRWLAKNQDDGSTERLLVAELLNVKRRNERKQSSHQTLYLGISDRRVEEQQTHRSSKKLNIFNKKVTSNDIQERVADSVNNMVKYFFKNSDENMTKLLCGNEGFCQSIELVFKYGYKSSKFFTKKLFVWDYIERVHDDFLNKKSETAYLESTQLNIRSSFCITVQTINTAALSIGKDQKFELFICLGLRDHHLQSWFRLLHDSNVTNHMYEQNSFFRDGTLLNFLIEVLEALKEFSVVLDKSITRGI